MDSNIIKLNFGSIMLLAFLSCTNANRPKTNLTNNSQVLKDSCVLDLGNAQITDLKVGCGNCHKPGEKRQYPHVPTYSEISKLDSLKLVDFVFKTRHNGFFLKDTILLNHNNKAIDSLNECEKRNLIHFIKSYGKEIPQILKTLNKDT